MALTRKFLSALGIEGDKVDEIINAHSETVEALKEERDTARKEAESNKAGAAKAESLQKEIDSLKEAAEKDGGNAWKVKYDAVVEERDKLKEEYQAFKDETSAKETKAAKDKAYRALLKEAGVSEKRIDAVMKVTDLEKVELDDGGAVKDPEKLKGSIKEEWAEFITSEETQGASTATPPANNQGKAAGQGSRAARIAAEFHNSLYGETPSAKEEK